jgi:hypothetical protein
VHTVLGGNLTLIRQAADEREFWTLTALEILLGLLTDLLKNPETSPVFHQ